MNNLRWGILSTAKIARKQVMPGIQQSVTGQLTAIASRNAEQARAVAEEFGITKSYGTYEQLLLDPEVDAIYIPLPNHMHVKWTMKCLEAGNTYYAKNPLP